MALSRYARPVIAMACAGTAAVVGLSGCGNSGKNTATVTSKTVHRQSGRHGSSDPVPLRYSKYYFMTTLPKDKLCGLLRRTEAAAILGVPVGTITYSNPQNDGAVCAWRKKTGGLGLYIGISKIMPWRAAATLTTYANGHPTVIDGHQANAGGWVPHFHPYASAFVEIAGLDDPVVQFRAPTKARAIGLARLVMPRLEAIREAAH